MVYLLRFSTPLGNDRHEAQYYMGYCEDGRLDERLQEHRCMRGAKITAAAVAKGAELTVVRTWPNATREDERRMKRWKRHSRFVQAESLPPVQTGVRP